MVKKSVSIALQQSIIWVNIEDTALGSSDLVPVDEQAARLRAVP